jgi:predicted RNA binding protein with dsRBD fold (UPF0201 family)
MSILSNWEKFCKGVATEEVNLMIPVIQQMNKSANTSGPVIVQSVQTDASGNISVTVQTQDGNIISGVQPGTAPAGPGSRAILQSGLKLG